VVLPMRPKFYSGNGSLASPLKSDQFNTYGYVKRLNDCLQYVRLRFKDMFWTRLKFDRTVNVL